MLRRGLKTLDELEDAERREQEEASRREQEVAAATATANVPSESDLSDFLLSVPWEELDFDTQIPSTSQDN